MKLAALELLGDLAFSCPLVITKDRTIVDGYGRWELAKRKGRRTLDCIERDLTSEQALEELVQRQRGSRGLSDFIRIQLALELEPYFQEKARMNQQAGGHGKGSSKLTEAQRVDSRREVARVAGVGQGNVRKVKAILAHACASVIEAAQSKEVSIDLAHKWSLESQTRQQEELRQFRIYRGIRRKAQQSLSAYDSRLPFAKPTKLTLAEALALFNGLNEIGRERSNELALVEVRSVCVPGKGIYLTEELIHAFRSGNPSGVLSR